MSDLLWDRRWWLAASSGCAVAAVAVVLATQRRKWHWGLFAWGLAVGILAALCLLAGFRWLAGKTPQNHVRTLRIRRRMIIYTGEFVVSGAIFGILAAGFDAWWLDAALSGYVLLFAVAECVAIRLALHRGRIAS